MRVNRPAHPVILLPRQSRTVSLVWPSGWLSTVGWAARMCSKLARDTTHLLHGSHGPGSSITTAVWPAKKSTSQSDERARFRVYVLPRASGGGGRRNTDRCWVAGLGWPREMTVECWWRCDRADRTVDTFKETEMVSSSFSHSLTSRSFSQSLKALTWFMWPTSIDYLKHK